MEVRNRFALLCAVMAALFLVWAPTALADDPYVNFTKCPTGSPEMTDPSIDYAICTSGLVREGSLKVGNIEAKLSSPMHFQFGLTSKEEKWTPVPHSTSIEAESIFLPNPFVGSPPPVASPGPKQPKKPRKKRCAKKRTSGKSKHSEGRRGKHPKKARCKKKKKQTPKKPPQPIPVPAPEGPQSIKVTLESAGDVRNVQPAAIFGQPVPLLELPLKIHLEGAGLGPSCYVGTDAVPVVLAPLIVAPPTEPNFGTDPNGFKVEFISLGGGTLEDATFAVASASGCGPQGNLDGQVDTLLGLPAGAGSSRAVMGNVLLEFAASGNDGTPPNAGEELQAAFEAAH